MTQEQRAEPGGRLLTLEQVVAEMVDRYDDEGDWPAEHRCTKTTAAEAVLVAAGRLALDALGEQVVHRVDGSTWRVGLPSSCAHGSHAPLLSRLADLVPRGQGQVAGEAGSKHRKRPSSPAPWTAPVAELLDEIQRTAVAVDAWAREDLGFEPLQVAWRAQWTDVDELGYDVRLGYAPPDYGRGRHQVLYRPARPDAVGARAALRDLPRVLALLEERDPGHPLVERPSATEPAAGERYLRTWHARAKLLTGHRTPWPALRQVPNPNRPTQPLQGPACVDLRCGHSTCQELRIGRPPRWVLARCPHCGSASLRQNPGTGAIVCIRPSCKDAEGRRHQWSAEELQRLGLMIGDA